MRNPQEARTLQGILDHQVRSRVEVRSRLAARSLLEARRRRAVHILALGRHLAEGSQVGLHIHLEVGSRLDPPSYAESQSCAPSGIRCRVARLVLSDGTCEATWCQENGRCLGEACGVGVCVVCMCV